jgi:(R,R)-butanediol dehydrogenase/meso-butanediol dehydrogenase/diacetyl reductase
MLQVNIHGPGDVRLDPAREPVAGANDIILRTGACGICGSDITYIDMGGMPSGPNPATMALGHEFAGTVETVGHAVQGIVPGQKVVVDPMAADNIGNGGPEGAFTPRLLVRNARLGVNVHAVPADMPVERAALVEPLSVAMHAVNTAAPLASDKVVVYGAGCIGLGAVVALRHKGVREIAVIDFSDERLRRARELGATVTVNPGRDEVQARLAEAHGASDVYGIPVVASNVYIEATGATAAFEEIVRIAPVDARVVVVSVHKKPAPLDLQFVLMKELTIKGSIGYPREFPEVIEMLKDSRVDVAPLISHRFALADFMEALKTARDPNSSAKVMITFDA